VAVLAGQVLRQVAVRPAELRFVYWQGDHPQKAWVTAIQRGRFVHYVVGFADDPAWESWEATVLAVIHSYYPKSD
jgi:hypothetical protein